MILKGNQRGGGQQLAAHLQNSFDNERVEVAEIRGSVAQSEHRPLARLCDAEKGIQDFSRTLAHFLF